MKNCFTHISVRLLVGFCLLIIISCQKEVKQKEIPQQEEIPMGAHSGEDNNPTFNLFVLLKGSHHALGFILFRQDKDEAKIVTLDTWVHLKPNREYLLQRAVDTNLDGDCTGTNWLTLGKGLVPQSILTDRRGNGSEGLWRDLGTTASGTVFDIHFRVLDALSLEVVLTSECHQYVVR